MNEKTNNSICEKDYYNKFNEAYFSKKDLIVAFNQFLENSGFKNFDFYLDTEFVNYNLIFNERQFSLKIVLKNVCNSGWKEKPYIKRIQVKHIASFERTTEIGCSMLVGITIFDGEPIVVVWSPLRYMFHNTIRSAYVRVESIVAGYDSGFYVSQEKNENIYICNKYNFNQLLSEYYKRTYVEKIEWL